MNKRVFALLNGVLAMALLFVVGNIIYTEYGYRWFLPSITELEKEQKQNVQHIETYDEALNQGNMLQSREVVSLALGYYKRAQTLDPSRPEALVGIAQTYYRIRQYESAENAIQQVLALSPKEPHALAILASIRLREDNKEQAKEFLQSISDTSDDIRVTQALYDASITRLDAFLVHKQAPYASRIEPLIQAIDRYKSYKWAPKEYAQTLIAEGFYKMQEYELCLNQIKQVLVTRTAYPDAWVIRGMCAIGLGQYTLADESFVEAKKQGSRNPAIDFYAGYSAWNQKKYDKAETALRSAIENKYGDVTWAYQTLGAVLTQAGKYDDAMEAYRQSIQKSDKPTAKMYQPIINILLLNLKKPADATLLAQSVVKQFPNDIDALNMLTWAYLASNTPAAAFETAMEAAKKAPNHPTLLLNLWDYYETQKDYYQAQKYYRQSFLNDPNGAIGKQASKKYNKLLKEHAL